MKIAPMVTEVLSCLLDTITATLTPIDLRWILIEGPRSMQAPVNTLTQELVKILSKSPLGYWKIFRGERNGGNKLKIKR
jgi:hypothetical protein